MSDLEAVLGHQSQSSIFIVRTISRPYSVFGDDIEWQDMFREKTELIQSMFLFFHPSSFFEERALMCAEADKYGNVQKARNLKLETEFGYNASGEYLIFGGVELEVGLSVSCL